MNQTYPSRAFALAEITILPLIALVLTSIPAEAIVRVSVAPEVGRQVFQLDFGGAGSYEDNPGDKGFSWSAGWTYHADNTLGFGVTVGRNSPESNISTRANTELDFDFNYITATVHVRAPTRSAFIPHLQSGFGYYKLEIDERTMGINPIVLSFDENNFGMFFGAGFDYLVAPHLSLGIIANYHFISLDQNRIQTTGLGDWYDTWDVKAVVSVYTR